MKIFSKIFTSLILVFCAITFIGCATEDEVIVTANMADTKTKSYYIKTGYVQLNVSPMFKTSGNLVCFDDGTVYVKANTFISIEFDDENYDSSNLPMTNFHLKNLVSAIKINNNVFPILSLDLSRIKIKTETTISPVFSDFDIIGFAIAPNDFDITSLDSSINSLYNENLISLFNELCMTNPEFVNENFVGIDYKKNVLISDKTEIKFYIEMLNIKNNNGYLILKTAENEIFFQKINKSESEEKFYYEFNFNQTNFKIELNFVEDISTIPLN